MAIRKNGGYYDRDRTKIEVEKPVSFAERAQKVVVVRRGRRVPLTVELVEVYGRIYNQGTQAMACAAIGKSLRTVQDWINKAREDDCEDELLLLLRDTHDAVESGGNRATIFALNMEHAIDDPKTALELLKVMVPSTQVTKQVKIDANLTAHKAPDMTHLDNMSDEEILLKDAFERAQLKRLNGGK